MPKNKNFDDKDIATNLLVSLKHLKSEYNTFTQETSNKSLYNEVDKLYQGVSKLQRDVYEMMCRQGWYKMKSDSKSNITKAYKKYAKSESELAN